MALEKILEEKFLKVYRMLRDDSVIELLELSKTQVGVITSMWNKISFMEYTCYRGPNNEILIVFDHGEGSIYEDVETIKKIKATGIRSCLAFFTYCPVAEDFLKHKEENITKLFVELGINAGELRYSLESLQKLEDALHNRKFQTRQEVERHLLGILGYCGDTICKAKGAKWHLKTKSPGTPDTEWEPLIELASGEIIDCFSGLPESILLWDG